MVVLYSNEQSISIFTRQEKYQVCFSFRPLYDGGDGDEKYVVVMNGEIIGKDANQSALKNKKLIELHKNGFCVRKFLKIKSGEKYWLCMGCASYKHHAEARAIADANKKGNKTQGADLYLYGHWWCCKPCWDVMISAGVRYVYLVEGANEMFGN